MISEKFLKEKSDEELIALLNKNADRLDAIKIQMIDLEKEFLDRESDYGKIALFLNKKLNRIKSDD